MHSIIILFLKKGLFEECIKEENVEVTVAATTSCCKSRL
jgi:hypothetical protein